MTRYLLLAALLAASTPCANAQFETRDTAPTLQAPNSIAVGDFNHDGKLDLGVAAYLNSSQVSVFLGNGDGTFQPPVNYTVGTSPGSVAAADFNHDGNLDLAVAEATGVSILLGNGDGTFQPAQSYSISGAPSFVTIGDFNNDGKPDLALIISHSVGVMLGNGDGTFQAPIITTPPYGPLSLATGRFNSNGKLDLVVGQESLGINQVQVLLGNGDGTFTLGGTFAVGDYPSSIAVADFRGNGKQDLAVACVEGFGVYVLLGNGDGTFQPAVVYPDTAANWITTSDLNGDGKLDLAVANFVLTQSPTTTVVSTLLGNGDGTFQPAVTYPAGKRDTFIAVGDFNGDKKPDLVATDVQSADFIVLLNTGVVTFSPTTPLDFAFQLTGTTSAQKSVTLTNTGTTALTISSKQPASSA